MAHNITLYSTGCPKCSVLTKKLDNARLEYEVVSDQDEMIALGMKSAPILEVDGKRMDFGTAVRWIGEYVSEQTPSG